MERPLNQYRDTDRLTTDRLSTDLQSDRPTFRLRQTDSLQTYSQTDSLQTYSQTDLQTDRLSTDLQSDRPTDRLRQTVTTVRQTHYRQTDRLTTDRQTHYRHTTDRHRQTHYRQTDRLTSDRPTDRQTSRHTAGLSLSPEFSVGDYVPPESEVLLGCRPPAYLSDGEQVSGADGMQTPGVPL